MAIVVKINAHQRHAGLRGLDGVKSGLAARMIKEGAHITHLRAIGHVDGEPAKEVIIPCQPGLMCMIPWKTAQQTLAEEVKDQSTLHWRHTFVDYKAIEAGLKKHCHPSCIRMHSLDPIILHYISHRKHILHVMSYHGWV